MTLFRIFSTSPLDCCEELRQDVQRLRGIYLTTLIMKHHKAQCSDPRDRVYALLGLAQEVGSQDMQIVDYSKTVPEVIFDVLIHRQRTRFKYELQENGMCPGISLLETLGIDQNRIVHSETAGTPRMSLQDGLLHVFGYRVGWIKAVSSFPRRGFREELRAQNKRFGMRTKVPHYFSELSTLSKQNAALAGHLSASLGEFCNDCDAILAPRP
jgi:hypothetical protein